MAHAAGDALETWTVRGVLLTDLWNEPLYAVSRTCNRLGHIDFTMVVPPTRAFLYYMMCPFLCYPVAAINLWGFYRCLKSMVWPKYYRRNRYSSHVFYGVQRRTYDSRQRRLLEEQVDNAAEIQHALEVTGGARNQFVDDPTKPGVAYFVVEQKVMKAEAMFTGENWAWAFISDTCRYLTPAVLAYLFIPSCGRLRIDLGLWWKGRLHWKQVRHPVLNFFKSYTEYNRAMQRINVNKAPPSSSRNWARNL